MLCGLVLKPLCSRTSGRPQIDLPFETTTPQPSVIAVGLLNQTRSRSHQVVPKARSSPDLQGRDLFMNDFTFVGIDVSKNSLDVALAPDAKPF